VHTVIKRNANSIPFCEKCASIPEEEQNASRFTGSDLTFHSQLAPPVYPVQVIGPKMGYGSNFSDDIGCRGNARFVHS
jgi:hypothetical protein